MVARILGVVVGAVLARRGSSELMTGMSYGPTPVRTPEEASRLPQDDYFCDEAAPMWSSAGRGDLKMMRFMGTTWVTLRGTCWSNTAKQLDTRMQRRCRQGQLHSNTWTPEEPA